MDVHPAWTRGDSIGRERPRTMTNETETETEAALGALVFQHCGLLERRGATGLVASLEERPTTRLNVARKRGRRHHRRPPVSLANPRSGHAEGTAARPGSWPSGHRTCHPDSVNLSGWSDLAGTVGPYVVAVAGILIPPLVRHGHRKHEHELAEAERTEERRMLREELYADILHEAKQATYMADLLQGVDHLPGAKLIEALNEYSINMREIGGRVAAKGSRRVADLYDAALLALLQFVLLRRTSQPWSRCPRNGPRPRSASCCWRHRSETSSGSPKTTRWRHAPPPHLPRPPDGCNPGWSMPRLRAGARAPSSSTVSLGNQFRYGGGGARSPYGVLSMCTV
jgi:hypothetical protein